MREVTTTTKLRARDWKPEEDAILVQYAHEGREGVAKRVGKTASAVQNRASALRATGLTVVMGNGRPGRPPRVPVPEAVEDRRLEAAAEAAESVSGLFADTDEGREALGQVVERATSTLVDDPDRPNAAEVAAYERECTEFADAAVAEAADAGGGSAAPTLTVRLAVTRLDSPAEHECDLAQELEEARIQLLSYALRDVFQVTAADAESFIAAHVIPLVEAAEIAGESAWRAEVGL